MAAIGLLLGRGPRRCLGQLLRRPFGYAGSTRDKVSFATVLERAENVMPVYAEVRNRLKPEVKEEELPKPASGYAHAVNWSWGEKALTLEGTGRSKKAARNAAARHLLKRLTEEEAEIMDPTRNPVLAGWAINWINDTLQASMDLQETETERMGHTCTWSCPYVDGETVVNVTAGSYAKSRREAMMELYKEFPPAVEAALETAWQKSSASKQPEKSAAPAEGASLWQVGVMHSLLVQRMGIRCKYEYSSTGRTNFRCTVLWDYYNQELQQQQTAEAFGTGSSKAKARNRAQEKVLMQEGHLPEMDEAFHHRLAELRQALDTNRIDDAISMAVSLMEASSTPASWYFFLPEVLRAALAERDEGFTSRLISTAIGELRKQGGISLELWEALLDEASFSLRHYRRASSVLEQLVALPVAEGVFPGSEEARYFWHFRHLLALERHGGLLHGLQTYELDPRSYMSVPTVDVHQIEGDKVVLTTPGDSALDILEGPRSLRASDLVLLVPIEVVPELEGTELGDGERLPASWQHPQVWLASISSVKGNPRSGEDLRLHTKRISRFGSDADEESAVPIALGRQYRLFFVAMETPLARMLSALRCLCQARLPAWSDDYEGRRPSFRYSEELRRALLAPPEETAALGREAVRQLPGEAPAEEAVERLVSEHAWCGSLTTSQRQAVAKALEERVSLIQGPPGTGKTHVACAIIAAWAKRYGTLGERILAVADSNVAADNLQRRLQASGIPSVRVGQSKEVDTIMGDQLWKAVRNATTVIATCIGSGMEVLDSKGDAGHFQRVVIDECTQASEPTALVALGRGCEQTVLIGDHRQLPATVLSKLAQREGLGVSLFERLANSGLEPTVLQEQRRMHSSIAEFPNREFYAGQLVNAVDDSTLAPVPGFPWPNPHCRVSFVDVLGPLEGAESRRGFSTFNATEAEAVAEVVSGLFNAGVEPQELCILTPYVAQRMEILRALQEAGLRQHLPNLSIDTIDGYQGMERDIVLFSATRSNASGMLGFLSDARRMNVMLTRARRGLIVFGNRETLRSGASAGSKWPLWMDWIESQGAVVPFNALRDTSPSVAEDMEIRQRRLLWQACATAPTASGAAPSTEAHGTVQTAPGGSATWAPPPPPTPAARPQQQWEKVYSEQYGRFYFWDKASDKVQWEVPADFVE